MTKEIEIERTFLAKYLPKDIYKCKHIEIYDKYIPANQAHPILRLRKKGNIYELTKKQPITDGDASIQAEHTIQLTKDEYDALLSVSGKELRKIRYYFQTDNGVKYEIDVYKDALEGLVVIDIEFNSKTEMEELTESDMLLADVTQEEWVAAGMLAGKTYNDIKDELEKFDYKPIL